MMMRGQGQGSLEELGTIMTLQRGQSRQFNLLARLLTECRSGLKTQWQPRRHVEDLLLRMTGPRPDIRESRYLNTYAKLEPYTSVPHKLPIYL